MDIDRDTSEPNTHLGISSLELTDDNNAHYRYFHCSLRLWSTQVISENANPEERYLYRVWREIKPNNNGSPAPRHASNVEPTPSRVLLNATPEFGSNFDPDNEWAYWATNYTELQEFTGDEIKVSDTFLTEVPGNPADLNDFVLNVDYHAVLYVHDTVQDLYYPVFSTIVPVTWDLSNGSVVTSVKSIDADNRTVAGVEFYNAFGQRLTSPKGMTIVVTRFTDGSSISTKQIFN